MTRGKLLVKVVHVMALTGWAWDVNSSQPEREKKLANTNMVLRNQHHLSKRNLTYSDHQQWQKTV